MKVINYKIFGVAFILLFFTLIGNTLKADDLKPVRLQLKWRNQFQFAGYYAAKIKGFYKDAGLDVSIKPGGYGISPIEEVKNGRADVGIYDPDIIFKKDGKVPLVALANIMQSSPYVIITLPQKHILKPTDLIGKRVLSAGDQGWNIFQAILYHEGIKSDLIKIIPRQKDSEEIIEDKGDAVVTYITTQPQRLKYMGYDPVLIRPVEYGIDFYGDVLFSSKTFAYADTKVTNAFIEATKKGWEYAFAHEDEMIDYIYTLPGERDYTRKEFLKDEARELRKLIMPDIVEIGHMNLGRWQYMLDIYKEAGITKKDISLKGFLYESEKSDFTEWLKPLSYAAIAIILLIINWQLRNQVRIRTVELQKEIESRKQAEELANESVQQIELMLDSANIVLWDWDLKTNQKTFNGKWFNLLKIDDSDIGINFDPFQLIHPDDLGRAHETFKQNIAGTRKRSPIQFRLKKADGEYVNILSSSRVIMEDEQVIKISGAIVDIDDVKKKETELLKISEELMQSNNELKKFAYIVSHNLRGPVVNMSSLIEMWDQNSIEGDNKIIYDKINICIKKLETTLNDLIEVVSHQSPENQKLTVIDFDRSLDEVIASIETQIKNSKISILRSFDVRTMFYSRSYFESIIINLLTNSIKYRSTDRSPIIQVSTTEDESYIILKVKDNGIGIDLDINRKKLFGLYQRFNPTIEGKGIGLFMIKSHIESLKGRIEVESELGVGTVFSIFFPKNINSQ